MKQRSEADLWSLTARERGMSEDDLNRRLRKLADLNRFCQSLRKAGRVGGAGAVREPRAGFGSPKTWVRSTE